MSRWKTPTAAEGYQAHRVLLFEAAGVLWGVALEDLTGVVEASSVLQLPLPHPALWGILAERDQATAVLDLQGIIQGPRTPQNRASAVVLFGQTGGALGLRVDRLMGLALQVTPWNPATQEAAHVPAALRRWVAGWALAPQGSFCFFGKDAFLQWVHAEGASPARP